MIYLFIPTPRPLQRHQDLSIVIAAVGTIFVVDELDVRLCVQKQDAVAARFLRTPPASSMQGFSTHTAGVPEQPPGYRVPSWVPRRGAKAAPTTSRRDCACARLCLFACARAPELLQLQRNISTAFVSRGNLLISVSTVRRGSRVAVTNGVV